MPTEALSWLLRAIESHMTPELVRGAETLLLGVIRKAVAGHPDEEKAVDLLSKVLGVPAPK